MASTSDIKNGMTIHFNNDLYTFIEFLHVKPGKGAAFVRSKLRSVTTGKVLDNTFPSGAKIEEVRIEHRNYQYLYKDESGYHFMNNDTYEQIFIDEKLINGAPFLKEGQMCEIVFHADEERPLYCDLPARVELLVTYTEPGLKGDTATNATKPAKLETGAEIRVPLFINEGDMIRVDTRDGSYSERVK